MEMDCEIWGKYKEQGEILNKDRAWDNRKGSSTDQSKYVRGMKNNLDISDSEIIVDFDFMNLKFSLWIEKKVLMYWIMNKM